MYEESVCSSIMSSVSDDDYVYYHTEIFDLLPSSQAARHQKARPGEQGACKGPEESPNAGEKFSHGPYSAGAKEKTHTQPPINLALPMQGRREAWEWKKLEYERERRTIGYWESWKRSQSINRKRVWSNMGEALLNLLPWRNVLHTIESRFGVGVNAYFVFLRYLLVLNLLHCVIISAFILVPTTFYGRGNSSESLNFSVNDSVLDFFLGTGILQRSPVFYSFYTPSDSLKWSCLNTPLLYLGGILTLLLLSFILVVRRMVVGYKHSRLMGKRFHESVSYKVFCGWDFNIQDPEGAQIKQGIIKNDLKLYLEEQSFSQREAGRTTGQWVRLYLLRVVLNLLVFALLAGAYCAFYYSTVSLQMDHQQKYNWFFSLFVEYLPAMVFTLVNFTLPHIFRRISFFEDYSLTKQVNITLVRSIFLKLASLGIYMFFLFTACLEQKCPENQFGKEIYKFMVFDFLIGFCETFFVNLPRMLLWKRYPESCLGRLASNNYFPITHNVLNQVSLQTLLWAGVYYCPLLPFFGTVKLVATFYMKKFYVLRCCVPKQKVFRASSSSVLFHFMLLLGLSLAAVSLGFALHQFSLSSASTCGRGPFGGGSSAYNVTGVCVNSLPDHAQSVLRYLYSDAFAIILLLAEIVILTYFVSRGQANKKTIVRLKDMLVMASSDKRFLVKQHTTLLKRPKKTRKRSVQSSNKDTDVGQPF